MSSLKVPRPSLRLRPLVLLFVAWERGRSSPGFTLLPFREPLHRAIRPSLSLLPSRLNNPNTLRPPQQTLCSRAQLCCPSVDPLHHLNVFMTVRGPELTAALEMRPHHCRVQRDNSFSRPAAHTIGDTGQNHLNYAHKHPPQTEKAKLTQGRTTTHTGPCWEPPLAACLDQPETRGCRSAQGSPRSPRTGPDRAGPSGSGRAPHTSPYPRTHTCRTPWRPLHSRRRFRHRPGSAAGRAPPPSAAGRRRRSAIRECLNKRRSLSKTLHPHLPRAGPRARGGCCSAAACR